jgi:hypothetical protein
MASTTPAPRLTAAKDTELLALLEGADTVELKLTVPLTDGDRAATGAFDPLGAQIRQVYFFDTRDLALSKHGVVVRARRIQRKEHDSVVKLRPVEPSALPRALHRSPNFGVEVDATPEGYVCSGSMKNTLGAMDVREAVGGTKPLRKLFSKEQRALYEAHAPEGLGFDALSILGPIFVLKLKFVPEDYDRKVVAELWLYPDFSTVLELSTKCAPTEALEVAAATEDLLLRHGLEVTGAQEPKTAKALEFFSSRLAEETEATATH